MGRILRRGLLGMSVGAVASTALVITVGHPWLSIILGIVVGMGYSASLKPTRGTYVDNLMAGGALGVPLWGLISVIAVPIFSSRTPEWGAEQMRMHFPALVGWVMYGAALGLLAQAFSDLAARFVGPEIGPELDEPGARCRVGMALRSDLVVRRAADSYAAYPDGRVRLQHRCRFGFSSFADGASDLRGGYGVDFSDSRTPLHSLAATRSKNRGAKPEKFAP